MAIAGVAPEDDDGNAASRAEKYVASKDAASKINSEHDSIICDETWDALDKYLNGYEDLRDTLKKTCRVSDLRLIKKSQLEVCRAYARKYKERIKESSNDS